jgi:hypothetical protein
MNRKVRSTLLLAAPALAAAAMMPPAAGSAIRPNAPPPKGSTASTRVHCGTVTGAPWSIHNRLIHVSGSRYVVSSEGGVSCSLVRKWVPGLTHRANHGAGTAVKGPSGFKCTSSLPGAIGKRVVAGGCLGRSTELQWAPKSKWFSYS